MWFAARSRLIEDTLTLMMRSTATWVSIAALLLLAGCSASALGEAEGVVCNNMSLWMSEGSPPERADAVASGFERGLADVEPSPIASAAERFVAAAANGDSAGVSTAADVLMTACVEAGWELPEG